MGGFCLWYNYCIACNILYASGIALLDIKINLIKEIYGKQFIT
jgi:hypothetical protein